MERTTLEAIQSVGWVLALAIVVGTGGFLIHEGNTTPAAPVDNAQMQMCLEHNGSWAIARHRGAKRGQYECLLPGLSRSFSLEELRTTD